MRSLAIIGTGIAGMACAYFLRNRYRITVFEKNDYVGGHTNTVFLDEGTRRVPVDTGFMVYNDKTYPNLIRFFNHLGIASTDTSMSFSVNDAENDFETSYTNLTTFFPSISSALSPQRYKLLLGMKKLFEVGNAFLATEKNAKLTLTDFIKQYEINSLAIEKFLLPMTAAIWSTPTDKMRDYPAVTLLRFLANHGMLGFGDQFQWKTLKGGSQQYKEKLLAEIGSSINTDAGVAQVRRQDNGVRIVNTRGQIGDFDEVIVATHADQALRLLERPTDRERNLLSCFQYNINPVVLHSDPSVMPKRKRAWASWNYRYESIESKLTGSTHYWMNNLQNVSERKDYFVSVDYLGRIAEDLTHWRCTYEHPRFDTAAINAQPSLPELNTNGPIYFCGSYFRYGFHEDAFTSALNLCTQLNDGHDPLS
ncbi:FAD-dependent oxidoreductase [Pelagicoccus sp. SDUM812002]|uniref:NAD(P)/FAD-dependent oxidoreductase n=1 Tax=Pelagicoccus sp. SDUM812002 TaxID=3041266 RepID=UPI00280E3442|nr:FAD-dependent oxidoreductase [Pelagicoccus sp. SDUM812002]MDQ8185046.1 FAD-dependent oxidoreductase [Pelagicoccus sp. SDUM812002]